MSNPEDILLFAIGNSGRRDDGLGWALADRLVDFPGRIEYRYQLQIEDAELMTAYRTVIFVDAWKHAGDASFFLEPCTPALELNFSTHGLAPEVLLGWCDSMYDHHPEAWLLGIRGESWDLQSGLSETAGENLEVALRALHEQLLVTW